VRAPPPQVLSGLDPDILEYVTQLLEDNQSEEEMGESVQSFIMSAGWLLWWRDGLGWGWGGGGGGGQYGRVLQS
jgi:hypothetical protein